MILSPRQLNMIETGASLARIDFHVFQEKVLDLLCAWDALDCSDTILAQAIKRVREHCAPSRCCGD